MKRIIWSTIIGATLSFVQLCRAADPLDTWTQLTFDTNNYLTSIAFGDGRFVAAGYYTNGTGFTITSRDCTNWTPGVSENTNILNDVTYGGGRFVAVGDNGTIVVSADGTNWTQSESGTTNLLTSITYGNGQFLAVGFSTFALASIDGSAWTKVQVAGGFGPHRVSYGDGRFFLINIGSILTSTNGSNWVYRFSANPGTSYLGIAYGNDRFVAVGSGAQVGGSGNVAISPDGITWTPLDIGQTNLLYAVAYGSGLFVGVAGLNGGDGGIILSSSDGTNWTPRPTGTRGWIQDVTFGNGHFVAVGSFNTIFASPPILTLNATGTIGDGTPQFTLAGPTGQSCTIQVSPDLTNWATLTNVMLTNETVEFSDPAPASPGQRFYRAVVP